MSKTLVKISLTVPHGREREAAMHGWFEGRVPDEEDLEAAGDMSMSDLLIHLFGTSVSPVTPLSAPQGAAQTAQETFYGPQGTLEGPGPSTDALRALSASGVTGAVHLRTLEGDVILSLNGNGDVGETEEHFLS